MVRSASAVKATRDAADTDVVVMDQLGLLIGVGIAAPAGEGSHGAAIFIK
jgi:hypothetical protein